MKRFYKLAAPAAVDGGWTVQLDGKAIKTPSKAAFLAPNLALAEAAAAEWNAQTDQVDPRAMPVTRAINSAIDRTAPEFDAVVEMVAEYGGSDLICYRAEAPRALVERQSAAWDPLIQWANERYGVRLVATTGVMHVDQPADGQTRLAAAVAAFDPMELTALYDLTALSGSLVIGLAVADGRLGVAEGWAAGRVDAAFQEEQWGVDEEAAKVAAIKAAEFEDAAQFLTLARA